MRADASSAVVHASDVPALFTSGSAKHCVVAAQPMLTNVPPAHSANAPPMHAWSPSVQLASAVREANCTLSFCAASAFWSWKLPDEDEVEEVVEVAEGAAKVVVADASVEVAASAVLVAAASVDVAEAALEDPEELSLEPELLGMFWRPGSCVMSVSWVPSAMGPVGFAGQEPAGERGEERPKGMVPAVPTARPPTKLFWFVPWNWHWNSPSSSEFFGADWQYGTASEFGCAPRVALNEKVQCGRVF